MRKLRAFSSGRILPRTHLLPVPFGLRCCQAPSASSSSRGGTGAAVTSPVAAERFASAALLPGPVSLPEPSVPSHSRNEAPRANGAGKGQKFGNSG